MLQSWIHFSSTDLNLALSLTTILTPFSTLIKDKKNNLHALFPNFIKNLITILIHTPKLKKEKKKNPNFSDELCGWSMRRRS